MNALGIIFSNIHDSNIPELTAERTMASIPFCGRYRLIDFALSNMINSGITKVGVITKSNYQSLMDHVGSGKDWDLARKNGGLMILPPFGVQENSMMYNTRLEALKGVSGFLKKSTQEYVIMSDSDAISSMDLEEILKYHNDNGADITMIYTVKNMKEISGKDNIILDVDGYGRVKGFEFNPVTSGNVNLYSNIMLIKRTFLLSLISESVAHGKRSFSRDVLAHNTESIRIFAYQYKGFMTTMSSLKNYYDVSMSMLNADIRQKLFKSSEVYTKTKDSTPTKYGANCVIKNSLIADGCIIEGEVYNSIIFRGVKISRGTVVKNSILMQDSITGENVSLNAIITDKDVVIRDGRQLSGCDNHPFFISKGSVI